MALTRTRLALATTIAGAGLAVAGATWLWGPGAMLTAGVLLAAVGLLVIDVEGKASKR